MGVAPIDALRAATIHGARAMNLDRAGSLAPGRWGDLLILEGDPLADIASTQRIRTVVRRGRVVHDVSPSARTR
jgi:imidazolonepropionase-like amidohydrolase